LDSFLHFNEGAALLVSAFDIDDAAPVGQGGALVCVCWAYRLLVWVKSRYLFGLMIPVQHEQ